MAMPQAAAVLPAARHLIPMQGRQQLITRYGQVPLFPSRHAQQVQGVDESSDTSPDMFTTIQHIQQLRTMGALNAATAHPSPAGWNADLPYYNIRANVAKPGSGPGAPASTAPFVTVTNQQVGSWGESKKVLYESGCEFGAGRKPMQTVLDQDTELYDHLWADAYATPCMSAGGVLPPQCSLWSPDGQEKPNMACTDQLPYIIGGHTLNATFTGVAGKQRAHGLLPGSTFSIDFVDGLNFELTLRCADEEQKCWGTYTYTRGYSNQDGKLVLNWDPACNGCMLQNMRYRKFPMTLRASGKFVGSLYTTAGTAEYRLSLGMR